MDHSGSIKTRCFKKSWFNQSIRKNTRKINFLSHGLQRIFIPPSWAPHLLEKSLIPHSQYVCPSVCLSVCLPACLFVSMYVCTYVRMYAPIHVCIIKIFFKKTLQYRCFSVNFAKFLIKPFFIEHLW